MLQGRGCTCFTLKPCQSYGIIRRLFRQEFEGDPTPQLDVFSPVYQAHSTATECTKDSIVRYDFTNQRESKIMNLRIDYRLNATACACIGGKQRFHFSPQFEIAVACLVEKEITLASIAFDDAMEELLDLHPTFRFQRKPTCR